LGEQDENGIVRLNIDFLICINQFLFYGQILGKMTTKCCFRATPPGPNGVIFRYDRGYDVVVQQASPFRLRN
jgi:hypothetical protein